MIKLCYSYCIILIVNHHMCYALYTDHDQQWFSAAQQWSQSLALFVCVCVKLES